MSGELWCAGANDDEKLGDMPPLSPKAKEMVAGALTSFDYDVLALHDETGGHAIIALGEAMLEYHGLYEACRLDRQTVRRFLAVVEAAYGNNPYHCAQHGADVAVGTHLFLTSFGLP